jgi:glutamine amidotransferase
MKGIALIDYGIGNLRSVQKALEYVGAPRGIRVDLPHDPDQILRADKVVLPGVGAFGDGMRGLQERGMDHVLCEIVARGTPLLGICLGMQLFFESSQEADISGLGFLPGSVLRFPSKGLKVPQTGWNQIHPEQDTPLLRDLPPGNYAYFNHSYYCAPAEENDWLASTEYGLRYASVVGRGTLYGVQFHPEKSQAVGLQILCNFLEYC